MNFANNTLPLHSKLCHSALKSTTAPTRGQPEGGMHNGEQSLKAQTSHNAARERLYSAHAEASRKQNKSRLICPSTPKETDSSMHQDSWQPCLTPDGPILIKEHRMSFQVTPKQHQVTVRKGNNGYVCFHLSEIAFTFNDVTGSE